MNFLLFGATGGTGLQFLNQALARGHSVTACVRDPGKLTVSHAELRIVQGDMLQPDSLAAAFTGEYDALALTVGVYHRKPQTFVSEGTRNIVTAAKEAGIGRVAVVTSLGCGDSKGQGNLPARLVQRLTLSEVIADKDRQEAIVRDSGLEWTFIRPPRLMSSDKINDKLVIWQGGTPAKPRLTWACSRASVASLLLRVLEEDGYSRTALIVSDPK